MEFDFYRCLKFYFIKHNNAPTFSATGGWYKSGARNLKKRVAFNWIFYLPRFLQIIYLFGLAPLKVMTGRNAIRVQCRQCKKIKVLKFKSRMRTSPICILIKGDRGGIFMRACVPLARDIN